VIDWYIDKTGAGVRARYHSSGKAEFDLPSVSRW